MVRISVIVTVHNAKKYLRECLDSVIKQTFSDIEILCMDGGSTDNSPQILKEYAEKDNRICIINDPNTSYGHKINEGIRQAKGEYISVLESDDAYMPCMLEHLYAIAEKYHPDFVNADYLEFRDIDGKRYQMLTKMYPKQDYGHLLESGKHPEDMRQILRYWTGIFKKDFLLQKDIRMNESPGASFQDMSFRFLTSALADTCYHLDEPVYLYRTDNPFSSVVDPKKAVVIADEFEFLKAELERRGIDDFYIWRQFYIWKYNDFCGNLARFNEKNRRALWERCYQELEKDRIVLEQNGSREYSQSIRTLLEESREDFWKTLERCFEASQIQLQRQERLYRKLKEQKLVIFGCGAYGKSVMACLGDMAERICCFTDNKQDVWHTSIEGHDILSPEDAVHQYPDALYIVANKLHAQEMEQQLRNMGIKEDWIHVY